MSKENKLTKNIWIVIMVLSLILIAEALFFESVVTKIIEVFLKGSGSSFTLESLDDGAVAFYRYLVITSLMYPICSGFLGLFCSWGLKKKENFAWQLGVFGSVLIILYGIIASVSEILICWVHKPIVCPLLMSHIVFGLIALVCLLVARKEFIRKGIVET